MSLRIISLLPSATEMINLVLNELPNSNDTATGSLVGTSHECDYPGLEKLPHLTSSTIKFTNSADVDKQVREHLQTGQGLYAVDKDLLASLKPDIIVTQSLCKVCSVDYCIVENIAAGLSPRPTLVDTNPQSLDDVLMDIKRIGEALQMPRAAQLAVDKLQARIDKCLLVSSSSSESTNKQRVVFLEWTEPMFIGGHWTPQLIAMAGATHPLNPATIDTGAGKSFVVTPEAVVECDPDVIIIAPCGLDLAATYKEIDTSLKNKEWFNGLRAVQSGNVWVVDGNQFFNRPGPRLVDALEWLVGILNGDNSDEGWPKGFIAEKLAR